MEFTKSCYTVGVFISSMTKIVLVKMRFWFFQEISPSRTIFCSVRLNLIAAALPWVRRQNWRVWFGCR